MHDRRSVEMGQRTPAKGTKLRKQEGRKKLGQFDEEGGFRGERSFSLSSFLGEASSRGGKKEKTKGFGALNFNEKRGGEPTPHVSGKVKR